MDEDITKYPFYAGMLKSVLESTEVPDPRNPFNQEMPPLPPEMPKKNMNLNAAMEAKIDAFTLSVMLATDLQVEIPIPIQEAVDELGVHILMAIRRAAGFNSQQMVAAMERFTKEIHEHINGPNATWRGVPLNVRFESGPFKSSDLHKGT